MISIRIPRFVLKCDASSAPQNLHKIQASVHWRTEWRSVVFSDESRFYLGDSDGRVLLLSGIDVFREGRVSVIDDIVSGHPQTFRTAKNIEEVSVAVRKNRLQSIAEPVGISSAICQRILTKDLIIHSVCQRIIPCMLSEDQSVDEINSASQAVLKDRDKNGFQKCFDDLYKRCRSVMSSSPVPLKTRCVEEFIHFKSIRDQRSPVGVVCKF
ncbi:hypothetical protein TNCV_2391021 [Trichonephila clavipes]|nr:hypothetical protein TNCV_2391021 [Trichonephila clavipes]